MKRSHAAVVEPRPAGDRHSPPTHGLRTVDTDGTPEEDRVHTEGMPGGGGARDPEGQRCSRATP